MKIKYTILFFCLLALLKAQTFKPGDVVLNLNYGGPQVTPVVIKFLVKQFYDTKWADKNYVVDIKNTGVFNGKAEYGLNTQLSLGFAASYWNMGVNVNHAFQKNDPVNNVLTDYKEHFHFDLTALALGVRGNYHFLGGSKTKVIDPYSGVSIGVTRYTTNSAYTSDFPGQKIPDFVWNYKSGWGTYFSTTIGVRIYPIEQVGINLEAGWDRGAFLFGGIAFKIHTPLPQFLKD